MRVEQVHAKIGFLMLTRKRSDCLKEKSQKEIPKIKTLTLESKGWFGLWPKLALPIFVNVKF